MMPWSRCTPEQNAHGSWCRNIVADAAKERLRLEILQGRARFCASDASLRRRKKGQTAGRLRADARQLGQGVDQPADRLGEWLHNAARTCVTAPAPVADRAHRSRRRCDLLVVCAIIERVVDRGEQKVLQHLYIFRIHHFRVDRDGANRLLPSDNDGSPCRRQHSPSVLRRPAQLRLGHLLLQFLHLRHEIPHAASPMPGMPRSGRPPRTLIFAIPCSYLKRIQIS